MGLEDRIKKGLALGLIPATYWPNKGHMTWVEPRACFIVLKKFGLWCREKRNILTDNLSEGDNLRSHWPLFHLSLSNKKKCPTLLITQVRGTLVVGKENAMNEWLLVRGELAAKRLSKCTDKAAQLARSASMVMHEPKDRFFLSIFLQLPCPLPSWIDLESIGLRVGAAAGKGE